MTSLSAAGNTDVEKPTFIRTPSQTQRLANMKVISPNRHDVTIVWLDRKMDPNDLRTQSLLHQLNDRVELFNNIRDCINYLYECQETILLIVSGKCATECLRSVHSLASIDSIIIYCACPKKYEHLINDTYSKILACVSSEAEFIQCVHKWIDLKCQMHFYTWDNQIDDCSGTLTRQTALFLANYLLPICIVYLAYGKRREEMMKISQAYYAQHPLEFDHIREFELTYTPAEAISWYTRDSFVHKIVNRAVRSFDINKLRAIAFYIRDLRLQLCQWRFMTSAKEAITVYHGLAMIPADIRRIQSTLAGSLLSTNGFLSTSRKREVAVAFAKKKQNTLSQPLCNVLLEINLGVDDSPIIFADIAHLSAFPEEDEILFDLGAVFRVRNVIYEEETQLYTIALTIASQNDYDAIEQLLKIVKYQVDERVVDGGQTSLIGKLLDVNKQVDEQVKKHDDYWQKFSLFRTTFRSSWRSNHDKYKYFFKENMPWITKFYEYFHNHHHKIEISNYSTTHDLAPYNELLLARFEPVLFFCLDDESTQQERANLSLIFKSQYRRFITKHLTFEQVEENLEEYYYIYYVSSELPLDMENNRRVKFYELKCPSENEDPRMKIKLMERLRSKLLHDFGMFYSDQANDLAAEQDNQLIAKALMRKGAECYRLLAEETDKIIRRHKSN